MMICAQIQARKSVILASSLCYIHFEFFSPSILPSFHSSLLHSSVRSSLLPRCTTQGKSLASWWLFDTSRAQLSVSSPRTSTLQTCQLWISGSGGKSIWGNEEAQVMAQTPRSGAPDKGQITPGENINYSGIAQYI